MLEGRVQTLRDDDALRFDFIKEMRRFLPPEVARRTVENGEFWVYLCGVVVDEGERVFRFLGVVVRLKTALLRCNKSPGS